jgi:hypothetical protein
MKTLTLKSGDDVLLDDYDFLIASQYKWHLHQIGGLKYAVARPYVDGKRIMIKMHRFILGCPSSLEVDHINGNGLDNRKDNLRYATRLQNGRNVNVVRSKSGFKGVRFEKGAWRADINGKYIGRFNDILSAAIAYDTEAVKNYGEFAKTNSQLGKI